MAYRIIFTTLLTLSATTVAAIEVSPAELIQLQKFSAADASGTSKAELLRTQGEREEAIKTIWLASQKLKQLRSLSHPTSTDIEWVVKQRSREETLEIRNADHPDKLMTIVDLSQEAAATEYFWLVNSRAMEMANQWQRGEWNWPTDISTVDRVEKAAMLTWINSLDKNKLLAVAKSYEDAMLANPVDSNQLLAILALETQSSFLFRILWQQPADQFSHMALQKITELEDYQAITQTIQALENPSLQSQALLLLSKNYVHDEEVQQKLVEALNSEELQWHAAMAMKAVQNKDAAKLIAQQIKSHSNGAHKVALSNLDQGDK